MKDSYSFYKDKLSKEYLDVFNRIEMYVLTHNFDDAAREERLSELLDIFISSDEAGRPVEKITGGDLEQFCRTFCSDFGWKNRVLYFIDWLRTAAWYMIIISAIDLLFFLIDAEEGAPIDIWHAEGWLNVSGFFIGIAVSFIVAAIFNITIRTIMFRRKKLSMKILYAACAVSAIISFFATLFIISSSATDFFRCPGWIIAAISCAYLLVYYPTRGKKIKRDKIKFSDLVHEETRKAFPSMMEEKYEKARKRNLRRGKGDLSIEAFIDKEESDCAKKRKLDWLYFGFPPVVTACACLFTPFDGVIDALIFVVILLTVEYLIMMWFRKMSKSFSEETLSWVAAKREEIRQKNDADACDDGCDEE